MLCVQTGAGEKSSIYWYWDGFAWQESIDVA